MVEFICSVVTCLVHLVAAGHKVRDNYVHTRREDSTVMVVVVEEVELQLVAEYQSCASA